jgi:hypothetical protein
MVKRSLNARLDYPLPRSTPVPGSSPIGRAPRTFLFGHNARPRARQRADSRPTLGLRQPSNIYTMPTPSRVPRTMRISKTFSRTPCGHKHGWDTVATRYGRPTSSHTPKEHGAGHSTTWDGLPAVETMHSPAQSRQHASDRGQQAQRTHSGKRRPHRHTQACCHGSRAATARRARAPSAPSRSDPKSPTYRTLQAGEPTAELPAPRREKRSMLQLSRMAFRMSSRPSCWPMRSSRSPTAAETRCRRRLLCLLPMRPIPPRLRGMKKTCDELGSGT